MSFQAITLDDQIVAAVLGDRTIISAQLEDSALSTVQIMCLYASEIHAGRIPGPYRDRDAHAIAVEALCDRPS